jgi:carboxyl-terminal processing protease
MPRKYKITLIVCLVLTVLSLSVAVGCVALGIPTPSGSSSPELSMVDQAWSLIHQKYVEPSKIDSAALSRAAVKGMVDALNDPYSAYLDPQTFKMAQSDLQGTFEGIGAQVNLNKDKQITIVAPLENSPAAKAGIRTGDIILEINGKSTIGLSLTEAVLLIRGPKGTSVKLLVQHEGQTAPVSIDVVRAQISSSSVTYQMRGNIAYIRITMFGERTNDELSSALEAIDLKNTTGIILDLRNNPGGIVTTVVDVASHFIKEGVIITMVDNQGNKSSISTHPNGIYTDLPIVVLVNQYSASGSEVLSGALRDHKRGVIAGVTTLGKGSYDINIPLQDGSSIYLTVGRWLTPNGQLIEGKGIDPDFVLTQTGEEGILWAVDYLKNPKK